MLLYHQDRIAQLEEELDALDEREPKALFLGSRRRDANPERDVVLARLESAVADYGAWSSTAAAVAFVSFPDA